MLVGYCCFIAFLQASTEFVFVRQHIFQHTLEKDLDINMMMSLCKDVVAWLMIGVLIEGCSPVWQSTYDTSKAAFSKPDVLFSQARLDPRYRYLRFEADGQVVLLPLGFVDSDPNGPVEVWYGADPLMIRLQNGRYFGSKGLQWNWQDIHADHMPDFASLEHSQTYLRVRTQMPGSEFNIHEKVLIESIDKAPGIAPASLKQLNIKNEASQSIRWFSETVISEKSGLNIQINKSELPAFYAVDMASAILGSKPRVIFGYQCLTKKFCISWQDWPSPWLSKEGYSSNK